MEGSYSYCYSSDSLSMFLNMPLLSVCFSPILKFSFSLLFTYHSSFHVCYFKLSSLLFNFLALIYCIPYFSALFRFMSFLSLFVLTFSLHPFVLCYSFLFHCCMYGFIMYIWFYYVYMIVLCIYGFIMYMSFYYVYIVLFLFDNAVYVFKSA